MKNFGVFLLTGIFGLLVTSSVLASDITRYLPAVHYLLSDDIAYENVAISKSTEQSSTTSGGDSSRAVDGDINGQYQNGSVTHTDQEQNPWWQVDLTNQYKVSSIVLHNRTDACCSNRLANVFVFISPKPFGERSLTELRNDESITKRYHAGAVGDVLKFDYNLVSGRYVRVQLVGSATLSLAEVEIFGIRDSGALYDVEDNPTDEQAASLLLSASFGPTQASIDELVGMGYSEWFRTQQALPINSFLDRTNPNFADTTNNNWEMVPRKLWFDNAIYGEDQLRQRASFALSQIFVVSTKSRDITFKSHLHSRYMDILQEGVFGNFRDLLNDITYSPMMGFWLTYVGNEKANDAIGSAPDENYAREIMQLFTIGLIELNEDGSPQLVNGQEVETYTTEDVSELAKVFTGLWWDGTDSFGSGVSRPAVKERDILPMVMFDDYHSPEAKTFLGHTIPAGTPGNESIRQALDVLFEHQNTAPFISKQLIQRMTTSDPSNAYIGRVSKAFNSGSFVLPDGNLVGTGVRGDMTPVWAAILFDPEVHNPFRFYDKTWGKVREPLIRLLHWARLADLGNPKLLNDNRFEGEGTNNSLGQNPLRANSVFNFYRPGFVAAGTETGKLGLLAPELQITTSTTIIHYSNFLQQFILVDWERANNWVGSYADQIGLADNIDVLIDALDLTMTAGRMTSRTRARVRETVASIGNADGEANSGAVRKDRVQLAMMLIVNSQEYNTQQ